MKPDSGTSARFVRASFSSVLICLFATIFLLFPSVLPVHATSAISLTPQERQYLDRHTPLVFVSQTTYPPFEFRQQNGTMDGMCIELSRWMGTELGIKVQFLDMPFQQAQEAVVSGQAHVLTSLFFSEKRAERFSFSAPLFEVPASIFVRSDRPDISRLEHLNGKRIAIQRGDYAKDFLDSQGITFQHIPTDNFAQATDAVISGAADALIGDEQIVLYHLYSHNLTAQAKKVGDPLYIGKNCMAVKSDNDILASILTKVVHHAEDTGVLGSIQRKWLGTGLNPAHDRYARIIPYLAWGLGGVMLLVVVIAVVNVRLRKLVKLQTDEMIVRESYFRNMIDQAADAIYVHRVSDGRLIDCNQQGYACLGYTREELLKLSVCDVDVAFTEMKCREVWEPLQPGVINTIEGRHRRKDGTCYPVEVRVVKTVKTEFADEVIIAIARDISERQHAENLLRENMSRLKAITDSAQDAIVMMDPEGRFSFWNPAAERIFGFTEQDVLGRSLHQTIAPPSFQEAYEPAFAKFRETGRGDAINRTVELKALRKDGIEIPVELSLSSISLKDGMHAVGIIRDISTRMKVERELHSKNVEIEQFIYTVSHDLRSPLVTIKTFMGYLEEDMDKGNRERVAQDISFINSATDKMKLQLDELLEMSRVGTVEHQMVDMELREMLQEVLAAVAGMISDRKAVVRLPETDITLYGDRARLSQLWQNLIENSIKYCPDTVIPVIELGVRQSDGETIYYVMDNGIGIDPQYHGKVFGIFDKLDPDSPGAGLGLSLVRRIVEKYGGRIWIESDGNGNGTCFLFTLPQVTALG